MKLFVGLGNPGAKYEANRHNIGFMAVERIAATHDFSPWRKKFHGLVSEGSIEAERVMLLKPGTYMNESGQAVGEAMRFLKIEPAEVYVFHDELDLAPSKIKVKIGGGNAGHNGLRSLSAHIGNEYQRVRLGIGHPGSKDAVTYFVLNDFAKAERRDWVEPLLDAVAKAAPHLAKGDDARFLSEVARFTAPEKEKPERKSSDDTETQNDRPKEPKPLEKNKKPPHPAGERAGKRQSALAENLKRWLSSRKSGD